MNSLSLYAGIVITQRMEELRNEAARATLIRSTRSGVRTATRLAPARRTVAKAFNGGAIDADPVVPPLRGYPYSPTR
jgi:hypothetical protein